MPDYVTFYSIFLGYTGATLGLVFFIILKNTASGGLIKRFVNMERIRENRIRNEKFRHLVAETHNAHESFKIYSRNSLLTLSTSLLFLSMSSGTNLSMLVSLVVVFYSLWALFNVIYFARCMYLTPVPENLKTIRPGWLLKLNNFSDNLALMNGAGIAVQSTTGSGLGKKILHKASKAASASFNYATDPKNTFNIIKCLSLASTFISGVDYLAGEATQRTTYITRLIEVGVESTYSPDPDTRVKAAALRRRGVNLLDCCEPNSKCLNPELVENKYEFAKPYETKRYLALEEKALALEEKALALEEKALALEEENKKLRLKEKHSSEKEFALID